MTAAQLAAGVSGALLACALGACQEAMRGRSRRRRRVAGGRAVGRLGSVAIGLGRLAGTPVAPVRLEPAILAAGLRPALGVQDVMAMKLGAAAIAGAGALVLVSGPGSGAVAWILVAAGAGFAAPDLWLRRRALERALAAALELPALLDLLRVAVEAGIPVRRGIAEVSARSTGILADELRRIERATAVGADHAALVETLPRRIRSPQLAALAAAIARAERHGAPIAPALLALSGEVRAARVMRLQERAAQVVPRMQLVIALVLVPAVLALVGAAIVARLS